jgi:hypothetical protein
MCTPLNITAFHPSAGMHAMSQGHISWKRPFVKYRVSVCVAKWHSLWLDNESTYYCDMTPESRNSSLLGNGVKHVAARNHRGTTVSMQRRGERISVRKDKLLGNCFLYGSCRDFISRIVWSIGLHKDYYRKGSVKKKNSGRVSQGAWREDELIGG